MRHERVSAATEMSNAIEGTRPTTGMHERTQSHGMLKT